MTQTQILQALLDGQAQLTTEVRTIGNKVIRLESKLNKVDNKVDTLGTQVDTLSTQVDTLGSEVQDLKVGVYDLSEKVEDNTQRLDKIGRQLAYLEDDTPTNEEFEAVEKRVTKLEKKTSVCFVPAV